MSIFVSASRIIMNLGSVGSQSYGASSAGYGGEYLASSASSMGADALTPFAAVGFAKRGNLLRKMLGPQLFSRVATRTAQESGKKAASAADIILWTITIVEILELTTGFGPPVEGDALKDGSQQFSQLSEQLKSALPDDGWNGTGSEAYAQLDVALKDLAQTMAGLDLQLATLVENQAEWVTHTHLGFGILKNLLLAAFLIEITMTLLPPPAGPVPARIFGLTVSALGIAAATGLLGNLTYWSVEHGKKANALADEYEQAAAATVQRGALAQAKVATTAQSTVSSFTAISDGMSGMAATPSSSPSAASSSRGKSTALSAQASASQTPGDGVPEVADKTNPPAPATPMPTLAQLSAMSGQAPQLSDRLSSHPNLANQAVQQLAQPSRQGQETTAPAKQAATETAPLANDADQAAAGAAGAQRAPIEINTAEHSARPGRTH
ncbi:EspA/EspE family type VII secretion system effector [Mycobacterium montefiorense]|uniref:EspA/EspE family type VII secretion system effector n=1 Tax=Mycobacterium montefiorense TaxID=154654 RepID=UPI0021DF2CF3|nr:EspA/EspE family type VII secretion system effector [Mycobacterium montefiorense]MCV7429654.1 hypothetical protein [Mycobacterium montefiorense]GLE52668.1 hypothetical protein ATCCBAA256_22330 [Mycobacterium montefiorense]